MFSFLWGAKSPLVSQSRFLCLTLNSGKPVLVNVDQVAAVYVRVDRQNVPCGSAVDLAGEMIGVKESFADIVDGIVGKAVNHV